MKVSFCLPALSASAFLTFAVCAMGADVPDSGTQVLKWKDGKKAVFLLAFDDSAPSQLKYVIPELEKRKLVGTFYLVTGNSLYANLKPKWEAAAKSPAVVVANHTFTHKGVNNAAELEPELAKCNEVLYAMHPDRKVPRLLGFGKPGGVPWAVTQQEWDAGLAKHHLVNRPNFAGPPIHYKSAADLIKVVDNAIAKGEMGHLDFHGVGTDWLVTPLDWFIPLVDKLDSSREELWVTDVVSWHQYEKERKSAAVKVVQKDNAGIRIELTATTDPALYNFPLTLSTKVPADWTECVVEQGTTKSTITARDGAVKYDAVPGAGEIRIAPVKK